MPKTAQFIEIKKPAEKNMLICKWVQKCYEAGKTSVVRASDVAAAQQLDDLLWTFSDVSFIPHTIAGDTSFQHLEPVLISYSGQNFPVMDVLIEAGGELVYPEYENFGHIIDFADLYDDKLLQLGRRRYKTYQDKGYRMRMVKNNCQ